MTAKTARNANGIDLGQAMALLLQNQARFVSHIDEDRQRFARIERELDAIKAILIRHEEILQKLPEAIREKIGFKS
jgi:hypothetical protein